MAYVEMTVAMMKQFGVEVQRPASDTFVIAEHTAYQAREYQIEPDVSAASYFMRCARLSVFLQRSAMYTGKAYREILLFTCAGTDGMPDRGRTGWNPDVSADGRIPGRGI